MNSQKNGGMNSGFQQPLPELPVPIPVLTNVRWSEERSNGGYGVLYGLQLLY